MISNNFSSSWKQLFKLNRIIPLLIILAAGLAVILSLFGIVPLSRAERLVVSLLGLLAADALTERISILDRIEITLKQIISKSIKQPLKSRDDLPSMVEQAGDASEIWISAVSGISLIQHHLLFFRKKIKESCKIRILLLNPNSQSLLTYSLQYGFPAAENNIQVTLDMLRTFMQMENIRNKLEVRLLNVFLPFSIFAVDLKKEFGSMYVEFHNYKRTFGDRPHIYLTALDNPKWFDFYKDQFEQAWVDATFWDPN